MVFFCDCYLPVARYLLFFRCDVTSTVVDCCCCNEAFVLPLPAFFARKRRQKPLPSGLHVHYHTHMENIEAINATSDPKV